MTPTNTPAEEALSIAAQQVAALAELIGASNDDYAGIFESITRQIALGVRLMQANKQSGTDCNSAPLRPAPKTTS